MADKKRGMQVVERYLQRYGNVCRLIKDRERQLLSQLQKKDEFMEGLLGAVDLTRPRVDGGRLADSVPAAVLSMEQLFDTRVRRLQKELGQLWARHDEMRWEMDGCGLDSRERKLIELKFVEEMRIAEMARRMNYSERYISTLYRQVVDKLQEVAAAPSVACL